MPAEFFHPSFSVLPPCYLSPPHLNIVSLLSLDHMGPTVHLLVLLDLHSREPTQHNRFSRCMAEQVLEGWLDRLRPGPTPIEFLWTARDPAAVEESRLQL